MELTIRSNSLRWALIVVEITVFLLITAWIIKTYLAYRVSLTPSLANLSLATKLDPRNADYHFELGRLYQYSVVNADPLKALAEFKRGVELDPDDPQGWIDLAASFEFQGKFPEAESCLKRADYLAPRLPPYQWPIANFYLLQGKTDEAFRHFRVVLAGTNQYDQVVFRTAWKASGDPQKILDELIPRGASTEFSYLDYLISQKMLSDTHPVWERIINGSEKFDPHQASGYIDSLIAAHQPSEAYQTWIDLQKKGLLRFASASPEGNLITNGDFEDAMVNMGFAWRISPVEGVYAGLDDSTFHSPGHSLMVEFPGKQNFDYRQVYQYVKVSPNTPYHLQAYMKADGITTDSGPRLEVRDAYNASALDEFTENLTGTTMGWKSESLDFKTGPKTDLLSVGIARPPSEKLDNLIVGKVWVDDVQLTEASK